MRRGWRTGMPSRSATGFRGGGARARPRPFSLSGWVTRAATSWPAVTSASKLGIAKAPLPMNTTRRRRVGLLDIPVAGLRLLSQLPFHEVALQGGQAIHEEQAVDVVDLV